MIVPIWEVPVSFLLVQRNWERQFLMVKSESGSQAGKGLSRRVSLPGSTQGPPAGIQLPWVLLCRGRGIKVSRFLQGVSEKHAEKPAPVQVC